MDSNTIDSNQAEQTAYSLTSNEQGGYQPRTLEEHNHGRYAYLPIFPSKYDGPNDCLLLANVPANRLASHEITRRQQGAYTSDALMLMSNYNYSDGFSLSEQDAEELATRLQVGKSIITFNADRLRRICHTLLAFHEKFRRHVLFKSDVSLKEPTLNSKQMAMALEFYLQIDVDLFYMKTCSFRGAEPRSNIQGLFCGSDEPQARYALIPCGDLLCSCCLPLHTYKKSQPWPIVDFTSNSMHRFVNGYTTYLNCSATCTTSNIVYAMTCPCGHYDYVDSTGKSLADAMVYHRKHGNRIIHEKLTGSPLFRGSQIDPDEREKEMANQMRLYQHSARCPAALRSFLDCNPNYWCFIPQPWNAALEENVSYFPNASTTDPNLAAVMATTSIDNRRVAFYLDNVPLPPAAYAFSYPQIQKQRSFFEQFVAYSIHQRPYIELDLYKMAIIAVLPDDCSTILRYVIETLFIIHGETKLNMICPLGGDVEKRYGRPYDLVWCANLNHSST
ncbi:unnamed protein product [Rotaria sp. Silwood1]|nr:unnamed protein product [Rotaria sp. Silwood1]CAF4782208.1 unnamed protein product [Rotaria sp. Silwood1]CAF4885179.1 unnamed protein product [Rotaria sp. Silwood1]